MMRNRLIRSFIIMAIAYLIDGLIVYLLPYPFTRQGAIIVPSLGLICFTMLVNDLDDSTERYFFSAICGLYYSIVYSNALAAYVLIYIIIAFVRTKFFSTNRFGFMQFAVFAMSIVAFKEVFIYVLEFIARATSFAFYLFILQRLLPTMLINGILSLLVYAIYPKLGISKEGNTYLERQGTPIFFIFLINDACISYKIMLYSLRCFKYTHCGFS